MGDYLFTAMNNYTTRDGVLAEAIPLPQAEPHAALESAAKKSGGKRMLS